MRFNDSTIQRVSSAAPFVVFRWKRLHPHRANSHRHHYRYSRRTGSEHSWLRYKRKLRAPGPRQKSPPYPQPVKTIRRTMESTRATRIRMVLTLRLLAIQTLRSIRGPAFISITRCLGQRMEVAHLTPERNHISSSNQICSVPPIKLRTCSSFEIRSQTATATRRFKQQPVTPALDTTRPSIFGAQQP